MLNVVVIEGRLTAAPELKTTNNGVSVTSFSIANKKNFKDASGEYKTDFFDVVAWRKTAEFVCGNFKKGSRIIIEGVLSPREYTDKNGNKRVATEITAINCHFGESKKEGGNNAAPAGEPQEEFEPDFGDDEFGSLTL